jgi:hypothetical protein
LFVVHAYSSVYQTEVGPHNGLYRQAYSKDILSDQEMKRRYFEERLPKVCSLDRRTISEYRIAGKFVYEHREELEKQGDVFQHGLVKKAYLASFAVKRGYPAEEIIRNVFALPKAQFIKYAHGQEISAAKMSAQPKSKFEGFVKAYEYQRRFFRI